MGLCDQWLLLHPGKFPTYSHHTLSIQKSTILYVTRSSRPRCSPLMHRTPGGRKQYLFMIAITEFI